MTSSVCLAMYMRAYVRYTQHMSYLGHRTVVTYPLLGTRFRNSACEATTNAFLSCFSYIHIYHSLQPHIHLKAL